MSTPPLLVFAALAFWGWQTGHVLIGVGAGAVLESSRLIKARWLLTQADFNRLWNVCTVLFIGVGAFLLINEGTVSFNDFFVNAGRRPEAIKQAGRSALVWFQWLPVVFLPFILAQAFNEHSQVGFATFSWWLRKQEARNPKANAPRDGVNVTFPFVALCLLAATATTPRNPFFYYGVAALIGWCLWSVRPKRYSIVVWIASFVVIVAAGYGGHNGLFHLQKRLEEMNVTWFSRMLASEFDPRESRTRLGTIGNLKSSDRIVLRVRTDGSEPPELLREASYNAYHLGLWNHFKSDFGSVFSEANATTWKLLPQKNPTRNVTLAQYLRGGGGLLALPTGSVELDDLPVVELKTNQFGVVKVAGGPGLALYQANYARGITIDSAFTQDDLRSFDDNEPSVLTVARELQLQDGMEPKEAMRRVANFFSEKFQYASYLTSAHAATTNETALGRFLSHTRSGHCEYFATATTLLLREAGIPTRYAVGYSVQEGSGRKYVVRERHGHAWTLVYYGGTWHDFDTTPSSWNAIESQHSSWLQPIKDFFSDLWFQFSRFRWSKTEWRKYFMWAPVPLLAIVLIRFILGKQWKKMRAGQKGQGTPPLHLGIDSEFYLIEKHFAARGLERRGSENWSDWFHRLERYEMAEGRSLRSARAQTEGDFDVDVSSLRRALILHQRHRFDPRGLSAEERSELSDAVKRWLKQSAGQAQSCFVADA